MPPAPPPLEVSPFAPDPEPLGPSPTRPTRSRDPWSALAEKLATISSAARTLSEGRATLDRGTLTIALPGGRKLAEGRRALRNPAVVEAVHRYYSADTEVEVMPLPNTGSDRDRQDALERQVLADPDMQRIMRALDAQLQRVVPLNDDGD